MSSKNYYAVNTLSGSEKKAIAALRQRIEMYEMTEQFGEILLPSEQVTDPKTKRTQTRRFFPGYIFVEMEMDNKTFHLVQDTPKIMGFIGAGKGKPPPMRPEEVERLTRRMRNEEEPRPVVDFEVGEQVRLIEGRYASMRGEIEEIDEARGKLRVIVNMFNRPVPTELSFYQVEKLS